MSEFAISSNVEGTELSFAGILSLKEISNWGEDASEYLNMFAHAKGKNKLSTQLGALSLLYQLLEDQQGTEISFTPLHQ